MGPGKLAGTFMLSKHRLDIVTRGAWAFTRPHRPHNLWRLRTASPHPAAWFEIVEHYSNELNNLGITDIMTMNKIDPQPQAYQRVQGHRSLPPAS